MTENNPSEKDPHSFSKPEFIVIEDTKDYVYGSSTSWPHPEEEMLKQKVKNPFSIRVLCFVGLIVASVFAGGVFTYLALTIVLAALFLFRNREFNHSLGRVWKLFKNTLVITVGLAIAIFSPSLGFSLLIVYFSLRGSGKEQDRLRRTLKKFL